MKTRVSVAVVLCVVLVIGYVANLPSQPSFNGTTPGCSGGGCHTFTAGILTATPQPSLKVQVTLSGTTGNVAGELVDTTGKVVAVLDLSSANPFTLTAPAPGRYTVKAGYKSPSRKWDSVLVTVAAPTGVSGHTEGATPLTFSLEQNYPNPFNPSTSIRYSLGDESSVRIEIFNILGEKVSTLVEQMQGAGFHTARVDMSGFPSGVYLYRLEATSVRQAASRYTETRSMVLMK
jgi:hypothetical protein